MMMVEQFTEHLYERQGFLSPSDFPSIDDAIYLVERDGPWWLRKQYTPWERTYDGIKVLLWTRMHYWIVFIACIAYMALIWLGPKLMEHRKPFDLKTPLKYWNLFLAIYSIVGTTRVVPHVILIVYHYGFHASLCAPPVFVYGRGAVGFWMMTFIYSKYLELLDTVFIILRKRNLGFLHWYHHVTVLAYTWDAFVSEQPPGIYYGGMNFAVHAIMYFYYYLAATMSKPPKWGILVTILQIAQMVVGVTITGISLYNTYRYPFMYRSTAAIAKNPRADGTCFISRPNMLAACAMYSTYFVLFADFFVKRYVLKSGRKQRGKEATKSA